jgi:hypothetical protein
MTAGPAAVPLSSELPSYRALLRRPGSARLLVLGGCWRLSFGGALLAEVLAVRRSTGSIAAAGGVAAVFAAAVAVGGPLRGRLVDSAGHRRALPVLGACYGGGLLALAAAAGLGAPVVLLGAAAAVAGAAAPPITGTLRAVWSARLGDGPLLARAYALESVADEAGLLAGPLLVAAAVSLGSATVALAAAAALGAAGAIGFAAVPGGAPRGARGRAGLLGTLGTPGFRTLVAATALAGAGYGALQVGVPAAATDGARAGLLMACLSAGSIAGGIWYGGRRWQRSATDRWVVLAWLAPAALAAPAAAGGSLALAPLLALAGLVFAPTGITIFLVVRRVATAGAGTEAFTWITTAYLAGAAAGNAVGGSVGGADGRPAFAAAGAAAAAAALVVTARRACLRRLEA